MSKTTSNYEFIQDIIDKETDASIRSTLEEIMIKGENSERLASVIPEASITSSGETCELIAKFYMMKQYPDKWREEFKNSSKGIAAIWEDEDYKRDWTSDKKDVKQYVNLYYLKGEYNHLKHGDKQNKKSFAVPTTGPDGLLNSSRRWISPNRSKIVNEKNALRRCQDAFDYLCTVLIKCQIVNITPEYVDPERVRLIMDSTLEQLLSLHRSSESDENDQSQANYFKETKELLDKILEKQEKLFERIDELTGDVEESVAANVNAVKGKTVVEETLSGYDEDILISYERKGNEINEGIPNGKGKYYLWNGDYYEGLFKDGKPAGMTTYYFNASPLGIEKLEGNFEGFDFPSYGTLYYTNGEKYKGMLKGLVPSRSNRSDFEVNQLPGSIPLWGPQRGIYAAEKPATIPVFNSITNNPAIGDERYFVRIGEINPEKTVLDTKEICLKAGKQYLVHIYVCNDASETVNDSKHQHQGVALVTHLYTNYPKFVLPNKRGYVFAKITAKNSEPESIWHGVAVTANEGVKLNYIVGSSRIYNEWDANRSVLSTNLFSEEGTLLGLNVLNGVIPGGDKYRCIVTYVLQAKFIGPNEPCPCGSGKKFKHCCG